MASPTQWTWVWVNSRSLWWTGRPGVLWFMGSWRVGHDWATELNWTKLKCSSCCYQRKFELLIFTVKQDIFSGIGHYLPSFVRASQVALGVKKAPAYAVDVRDTGLIPVSQELLEEGMATSSSILAWENLMYGVAWWATVHGVAKIWTQLKQVSTHAQLPLWNQTFWRGMWLLLYSHSPCVTAYYIFWLSS